MAAARNRIVVTGALMQSFKLRIFLPRAQPCAGNPDTGNHDRPAAGPPQEKSRDRGRGFFKMQSANDY
jgi:hypothetical protein